MAIFTSADQLIGKTPLLELTHIEKNDGLGAKLLAKLELNDDGDRLLKYAQQANDILQEYRIRLQRQKIGVLATTMTECYKKLANKKNLIERIEMDEATLDFSYLDYTGEIIPNGSLSAGERQLMVISLLWAL